jgi:hypothetical protein
VNTVMNIRVP